MLCFHGCHPLSLPQVGLMQSITLPAGAAQVDDGFRLGLLTVAIRAAARAAELEAERPDSYDVATRGLRRALNSLGPAPEGGEKRTKGGPRARKGGASAAPSGAAALSAVALPAEVEALRVETLTVMEKAAAAAVAARRPLVGKASTSSVSSRVPAKEFNPRCGPTPIDTYA